MLKDGITPCKTIQAEGKDAGISWSSIRRAADSMIVVKKKGADGWYWKLNDRDAALQQAQEAQEAQEAQPLKREHLEHLEVNQRQSMPEGSELEHLEL